MDRRNSLAAWLLILLCLSSVSGCGWWSAQAENGVEDDLSDAPEDLPATAALPKSPAGPALATAPGSAPAVETVDRVTLVKTVSQTLRQPAPQGWIECRSTLELTLAVTIEPFLGGDRPRPDPESRSGPKRVQVDYRSVRFRQDVPGQPAVEYDSAVPPSPVPPAALGYHGLKDNSLEFRLTADNQLLEVVAFDQFASRCLKEVPPEHRRQVSSLLEPNSPAAAVSAFVDDTVGLLPTGAREGDAWVRDRKIGPPLPLATSTRYSLLRLTPGTAEIEIQGTISALATARPTTLPRRDFDVAVRRGYSAGSCLLDRRTGLPMQSRVEQSLEMHVRLADGGEFDQYRSTLTTIKTVPEQVGQAGGSGGGGQAAVSPPRISQTGGGTTFGQSSDAKSPPR
jgi:hypothetical protein